MTNQPPRAHFRHLPEMDFLERAACRDNPEPFFGPEDEPQLPRLRREARAKAICSTCPVVAECLSFALDNEEYGIWGNTTESERRAMRRAG